MLVSPRRLWSRTHAAPLPLLDLKPMHRDVRDDLDRVWRRVVSSGSFVGGFDVTQF